MKNTNLYLFHICGEASKANRESERENMACSEGEREYLLKL